MGYVVRGARGLVIKNDLRILMTVKGLTLCVSTKVEQLRSSIILFITTSPKITKNHTSILRSR